MLKLNEFCQNHPPSGLKMLVKFFRRGIRIYFFFYQYLG